MKLLRYGPPGSEKPGLFANDGTIRCLSSLVRDVDGFALSDASLRMIASIEPSALPKVEGNPRIGACVVRPVNYVCIGLNYADHAAETGNPIPKEPIVFLKSLGAFTGPNDDVKLPRGSTKLDWECELGVVIGKTARYVPEHEAMDQVAGYCVCNDVSEREYQTERGGTWDKGKGCDTFGPTGPWMVTKDEISDPQDLPLWTEVNGKRFQDGSTQTMIFGVRKLVSYVSHFITLHAGDVIATGTPPGVGVGVKPEPVFLKLGDVMRLGIEGLGIQTQRVIAA
ncbi:fumarylacetoacetate hydrolase family protein [Rhodopila sp.]|uniref:fumarylacetoacetate hydrolase family protein n=1 Tax=Rhodopila sp. TaxID=2480087 RepID=UPI003D0F917C